MVPRIAQPVNPDTTKGTTMQITFDTANLTDLDKQVLALLSGGATAPAPTAAKATPAPAKKAAAAKPETTPEPEPEADEPAGDEVTLEDAKTLATKMVANGEAAKVKAALGTVGAKKVSEVPEDKVAEFVAALG